MVNRKKRIRYKLLALIFVICVLASVCFVFVNNAIKNHYQEIAAQEGIKVSSKILSNCISEIIASQNFKISDVISIQYGEDDKITSIETDAGKVNEIQLEILQSVNSNLSDVDNNCSDVPFGTLTDLPFLVGEGPNITIKYSQQGSATVDLTSEFEGAGVNQTVHRLYAHVETNIYSVSPIKSEITKFSFDYLLSETIIVGEVPRRLT